MKEVKKLKEAGIFIVEEWLDVRSANGEACPGTGEKTSEYVFVYAETNETLLIRENKPNKKFSLICHAERVLEDVADEERQRWAYIEPIDGTSFKLYNPRVRFLGETL